MAISLKLVFLQVNIEESGLEVIFQRLGELVFYCGLCLPCCLHYLVTYDGFAS